MPCLFAPHFIYMRALCISPVHTQGTEVILRAGTSAISSARVFYTDANGREMVVRRRDYRGTWGYEVGLQYCAASSLGVLKLPGPCVYVRGMVEDHKVLGTTGVADHHDPSCTHGHMQTTGPPKGSVSPNYYPITSAIAINDPDMGLALVTDRAHGGSSLAPGQLEVMLHRRCMVGAV